MTNGDGSNRVLFLSTTLNRKPWYDDFSAALGPSYAVTVWEPNQPFINQVRGAIAVADAGAPVTHDMIDAAGDAGVRLWQLLSAGYDHVDLKWFRERKIEVANVPGACSASALAEHALLLMLCTARRFQQSQEHLRRGAFYRPFGDELAGKTLGVVGLGASGVELGRIGRSLRMDVLAIDLNDAVRETAAKFDIKFFGGTEALDRMLAESDYVSIHVPLTHQTRGLFDARRLRAMKPSAVLINVARGAVIDEHALVRALQTGVIRAAGLDVFAPEPLDADSPLLELDNVVATPHIAGSTHETSIRRGSAAAENVKRVVRGLPPLYEVTG